MDALDRPVGLDQQFALDTQGLESLRRQAARDPQEGLQEAARQFEALFVQMMIKSMRDAIPRSDLMDSQQMRFYDSLMDQQWAQQMAGRGLGLAEELTAQLSSYLDDGR